MSFSSLDPNTNAPSAQENGAPDQSTNGVPNKGRTAPPRRRRPASRAKAAQPDATTEAGTPVATSASPTPAAAPAAVSAASAPQPNTPAAPGDRTQGRNQRGSRGGDRRGGRKVGVQLVIPPNAQPDVALANEHTYTSEPDQNASEREAAIAGTATHTADATPPSTASSQAFHMTDTRASATTSAAEPRIVPVTTHSPATHSPASPAQPFQSGATSPQAEAPRRYRFERRRPDSASALPVRPERLSANQPTAPNGAPDMDDVTTEVAPEAVAPAPQPAAPAETSAANREAALLFGFDRSRDAVASDAVDDIVAALGLRGSRQSHSDSAAPTPATTTPTPAVAAPSAYPSTDVTDSAVIEPTDVGVSDATDERIDHVDLGDHDELSDGESADATDGEAETPSTSRRRRRRRRGASALHSVNDAADDATDTATNGSTTPGTTFAPIWEAPTVTASRLERRADAAAMANDTALGYGVNAPEPPTPERNTRNGYDTYGDFGPFEDPYTPYTSGRNATRNGATAPQQQTPQPAQPWDIANAQQQLRQNDSPFSAPEPSFARGFGPQPRGVATSSRDIVTRPTTRTERGLDAPPMSPNQLSSVVTQAIQQQTDRLLNELRFQQQPPTMTVMLPAFPSTERVGIFVDVANLLYSARNMRISVDFGKLLDFLRGNRRLMRAHAYAPTNPDPNAEQAFLSAVKGLGYRITTKNYKTFSSGAKKADLDLDLCMDIVRLVDAKALDTVVLVSGDSDFLPLLEYCSDHGVRVEAAAFEDAAAMILRQSCDLFINLSLAEDIRVR